MTVRKKRQPALALALARCRRGQLTTLDKLRQNERAFFLPLLEAAGAAAVVTNTYDCFFRQGQRTDLRVALAL